MTVFSTMCLGTFLRFLVFYDTCDIVLVGLLVRMFEYLFSTLF